MIRKSNSSCKKRRDTFFKLRSAGTTAAAALSGFGQAVKAAKVQADEIATAAATGHDARGQDDNL